MDYETTVNYKVISETESEFPAVTICNVNAFDPGTYKYSSEYIKYYLKKNKVTPNMDITESEDPIERVTFYSTLLKAIILSEKNFSAFNLTQEQIGFTINTMLISCYFNGLKCSESDFKWTYTFEYGNCYTFNNKNNPARKTKISGPNSGLVLELYVGKEGII